MNIHILLNYIDLSRQATANLHIHWPRISLKLVVTCVINWQAGTKLIRHGEERDGFVTPNTAAIKKRYDGFKGISGLFAALFSIRCVVSYGNLERVRGHWKTTVNGEWSSLFNVRRAVLHSLCRFLFIFSNVLCSRFAIQCSPRASSFAEPLLPIFAIQWAVPPPFSLFNVHHLFTIRCHFSMSPDAFHIIGFWKIRRFNTCCPLALQGRLINLMAPSHNHSLATFLWG